MKKQLRCFLVKFNIFEYIIEKMTINIAKAVYETGGAAGLSNIYFDQDVEIRRIRFYGEENPIYTIIF